MSEHPQTQQRLAGPRHLLAGRWRRRLELTAVAAALSPVWLALVAALLALVAVGVWAAVAFLVAWTVALATVGRSWAVWSYWRARWWFDARAAGLSLNAEAGLFGTDAGADDDEHLVVVPVLRSLRLTSTGRRYRVRPLPGQLLADFEVAADRLSMRWGAVQVVLEHSAGDRFVTLVVYRDAPEPVVYERAA